MEIAISKFPGRSEAEKLKLKSIFHDLGNYESNHQISYTDFITAVITHKEINMTPAKVKSVFKIFDLDANGEITE